ncbi:GNAT family N-acetyltransferase [Phenylobacterium sp.]|uniref:GNAT family N-acetyltransferase n=1 Tax=Phenylobacterium sp. TaxID=1871053 RepID=UPI002718C61B|nr:GNAT family N-acetyltransferase [Phenylobacterium sp.]MDO8380739.1 GNAT family N-acetyltransferase [Phenylobacterium sp.]
MTTPPNLQIRPTGAAPQELAAYSALLQKVFGAAEKFSPEALAWRYRDNPDGAVLGFDAWDGDRLCAHYVTCPTTARIGTESVRGLLSMNTATDPDYAGQGLFTRLAQAAYAAAPREGFGFVMGVANANSTPGFLRKLGFQLVAPLEAGLLLRRPSRFETTDTGFRIDWTPRRLAWRLANPASAYGVRDRAGLTLISAPTHLPLVRCVGFVSEGLVEPGGPALGASLFIGLEPRLDLRSLGLLRLPQRFRPSPLNLIYRPLNAPAPASLDAARTAIGFLDFDPY